MKGACIGLLALAGFVVLLLTSFVLYLDGKWGWLILLSLSAGGLVSIALYVWLDGLFNSDEYPSSTDYPQRRHPPIETPSYSMYPQAFVYFIENQAGHVKIGWSKDPVKRLKTLQTGSSDLLTLVYVAGFIDEAEARYYEGVLHRSLAARRVYGEWFMAEGLDYEQLIDAVAVVAP